MNSDRILTVTSANIEILNDYGKETLPSIVNNMPNDNKDSFVLIMYDGEYFYVPDMEDDKVCMMDELEDESLFTFYNKYKETLKNRFRLNAAKFCWKVFSLYRGLETAKLKDCDFMVWLDADVYVDEKVEWDEISNQMDGCDIAWLDRPHFTHGETGLMIFDVNTPWTDHMLTMLRNMYVNETIFMMKEWHDAYLMTFMVHNYAELGMVVNNMNRATKGTEAFAHSPFADKMRHIK